MRIAVVRPVRRTKQGQFQCRIILQFVERLAIHSLRVLREEHRFTLTKRRSLRKELRPDRAILHDGWRLSTAGHRLPQRDLRCVEIRHELHARHVEGLGTLVEMLPFAVLRQHVADIELRELQQVTEILLVLVAVQSPHRPATIRDDIGSIGLGNR